ncbi:CpsD/CapB family tyrosine-protein kinase [Pontibaca salina]|uniref:CpsD/CapB family tyrosine-protein kinase n=1 Tax=Pontibaca salina TaxID=2795731 RepID=A0A934M220_9RHOB|nr:CpsD/CapB family tyrosine-protein kinase [Pontibaca salina]MBI6630206.1 CpsD/CapB family tyrosine-protein kinase [Pontibaca salina]
MTQMSGKKLYDRQNYTDAESAKVMPSNDPLVRAESMALLPLDAGDPARHFEGLPLMRPDRRGNPARRMLLADFFRPDPARSAFDLLRTRLLQSLRSHGWNRIAIAAPTSGCGTTFTAVNLAQSIARVPGSRTVLMDMNQRNPGIATALDLARHGDLPDFLSGRIGIDQHLMRTSDTLAVGQAYKVDRGAAEVFHDPRSADSLVRMNAALRPDAILYDFPAVLEHDDLAAFLPQLDGVLLVTDGTRTLAREIAACERILEGQSPLLGVILNRARRSG